MPFRIRRIRLYLPVLSVLLTSCGPARPATAFAYAGKGSDYASSMYFEDDYFRAPATQHNTHLATASLSLAMASFASSLQSNVNALTRYVNARDALGRAGFLDFQTNEDYTKRSSTDTIGLVFAHKMIDDKQLVYVGIRGANYEAEWASNFTIASPDDPYQKETVPQYHYGFHKAATQLIDELKAYLSKVGISGPIKLWTSGYSRAGATANIASGLLDEAIEKGEKPLGDNVQLAKEDLYAYCFEPPMGAPSLVDEEGKLLARGERYSNIFNYVNFNDPVPLVAMKEVSFTRFGQDRYLPDPMSYLDYGPYLSKVKEIYEAMPNYAERGATYRIPSFTIQHFKDHKLGADERYSHWTQGLFLKEFVSAIARFGMGAESLDKAPEAKALYVEKLQPALRYIFNLIYVKGNFKGSLIDIGVSLINDIRSAFDIDDVVDDLFHKEKRKFLLEDLSVILRRGLSKFNIEFSFETAKEWLGNIFSILLKCTDHLWDIVTELEMILTWVSKDNISSIASGHFPEICLSSMRALDSYYVDQPFEESNHGGKYFTLTLPDKKGLLTVKRQSGEILAHVNGEKTDSKVPARRYAGGLQVVLPYGETYVVTVPEGSAEPTATLFDYRYRANDIPHALNQDGGGSYILK